ncbi:MULTISPECIES: 4-carboxy-4-hydroxy-2-oxoadipate aldolase/oxaloacetate decarboxylase [Ramlibacter]|uniref:4-carboxy-4-hydroxy-2-oxoadipate aldolase/oxaloacetate decarboxylase n=1 Tax=Ramlibacter pinisoli TaxID=2682844 RepID=A0A6N8INU8_9BURK|nr:MULTISPECIES: 4-carboxy-4-hydroxy-2-oxoadipate aldolase/oxaloacetate decarboxylase [Ramlibacter]MBA2963542.1 4-carboxy-4-hydroxy-2-oxoadipate aldolase/oxaloacetate decarboxylase [Ramlibacter sp. CGMCC 1.13660]MVQ28508.1 4-carboxy-4-hydroxy-2-oxoadipate aldolase/oxaloacetate decarboxylase [Ramlibacter pinisoli]
MSPSKVYLKVNRVPADIVAKAREITVADIHEAMGPPGRAALMAGRMRPLQPGQKIAGPAVTAFCWPGDNLMMHRALYLAQPGDVLVVVCQAELSGAQWGDLATRYAMKKGLAGVVVQGSARDIDQVRELGFPVWSTHISPIHPDKSGHGYVNAPVVCEGVNVCPGDLIVADGDGVIAVPRKDAARVVAAAQAKMSKEDEVIEKVRNGAAVWDLSGAAAIYAKLEIEEVDAAFDD